MTIGFIGGGKMAEAIIAGLRKKNQLDKILIVDVDKERTQLLEENYQTMTLETIEELLLATDTVILAVKPQILLELLMKTFSLFEERHLVISIAAGVKLDKIQEVLSESKIVRVMPNTPGLIGQGASAIAGLDLSEEDKCLVDDIFSGLGNTYWLPEKYFDAVTAVSGSGPAYVYLFIEALIDAGVLEGLPRDIARNLALDTVIGSAVLVRESGKHPSELRDMVTSPGGTTIAALEVLEETGMRNSVLKAVKRAAKRSKELGE